MATYSINAAQTFAAAVLMGSQPKEEFGKPGEQSRSREGQPLWQLMVAVTFLAEPGRRVESDVLTVTVPGTADPAEGITLPAGVELPDLRMGVSAPQASDGRVRGGKPYWSASSVRPVTASPANGRQRAEASA